MDPSFSHSATNMMFSSFATSIPTSEPRSRSNIIINSKDDFDDTSSDDSSSDDNTEQAKARFGPLKNLMNINFDYNKNKNYKITTIKENISNGDILIDAEKTIKNPYVLIIGIGDYELPTTTLKGITKDINKMKELWSLKYNFKNVVCINDMYNNTITAQKLQKWLNTHRRIIEDKKDIDSLIMYYSGHGVSNNGDLDILCSDNKHLSMNKFKQKFSSDDCDQLGGKPKIFYLDCCRVNDINNDVNDIGKGTSAAKRNLTEESDIFIHYGCCDNKPAILNKNGSLLTTAIYDCYIKNINKPTTLTSISNRITLTVNVLSRKSNIGVQIPPRYSTLTYDVHIEPVPLQGVELTPYNWAKFGNGRMDIPNMYKNKKKDNKKNKNSYFKRASLELLQSQSINPLYASQIATVNNLDNYCSVDQPNQLNQPFADNSTTMQSHQQQNNNMYNHYYKQQNNMNHNYIANQPQQQNNYNNNNNSNQSQPHYNNSNNINKNKNNNISGNYNNANQAQQPHYNINNGVNQQIKHQMFNNNYQQQSSHHNAMMTTKNKNNKRFNNINNNDNNNNNISGNNYNLNMYNYQPQSPQKKKPKKSYKPAHQHRLSSSDLVHKLRSNQIKRRFMPVLDNKGDKSFVPSTPNEKYVFRRGENVIWNKKGIQAKVIRVIDMNNKIKIQMKLSQKKTIVHPDELSKAPNFQNKPPPPSLNKKKQRPNLSNTLSMNGSVEYTKGNQMIPLMNKSKSKPDNYNYQQYNQYSPNNNNNNGYNNNNNNNMNDNNYYLNMDNYKSLSPHRNSAPNVNFNDGNYNPQKNTGFNNNNYNNNNRWVNPNNYKPKMNKSTSGPMNQPPIYQQQQQPPKAANPNTGNINNRPWVMQANHLKPSNKSKSRPPSPHFYI